MSDIDWPEVILILGLLFLALMLIGGIGASFIELRRLKIDAARRDELRQLVDRYEKLAEASLDTQQRTAADVSEFRARVAAIEQILRTVE
jgi:hypothetical protein